MHCVKSKNIRRILNMSNLQNITKLHLLSGSLDFGIIFPHNGLFSTTNFTNAHEYFYR